MLQCIPGSIIRYAVRRVGDGASRYCRVLLVNSKGYKRTNSNTFSRAVLTRTRGGAGPAGTGQARQRRARDREPHGRWSCEECRNHVETGVGRVGSLQSHEKARLQSAARRACRCLERRQRGCRWARWHLQAARGRIQYCMSGTRSGRGEARGSRELCVCAGHQIKCNVMIYLRRVGELFGALIRGPHLGKAACFRSVPIRCFGSRFGASYCTAVCRRASPTPEARAAGCRLCTELQSCRAGRPELANSREAQSPIITGSRANSGALERESARSTSQRAFEARASSHSPTGGPHLSDAAPPAHLSRLRGHRRKGSRTALRSPPPTSSACNRPCQA